MHCLSSHPCAPSCALIAPTCAPNPALVLNTASPGSWALPQTGQHVASSRVRCAPGARRTTWPAELARRRRSRRRVGCCPGSSGQRLGCPRSSAPPPARGSRRAPPRAAAPAPASSGPGLRRPQENPDKRIPPNRMRAPWPQHPRLHALMQRGAQEYMHPYRLCRTHCSGTAPMETCKLERWSWPMGATLQ